MELHSWTVNEIEVLVDVYVRRRRLDKATTLRDELNRRLEIGQDDQEKLSALLLKLTAPKVVGFPQRFAAPVVELFSKRNKKSA